MIFLPNDDAFYKTYKMKLKLGFSCNFFTEFYWVARDMYTLKCVKLGLLVTLYRNFEIMLNIISYNNDCSIIMIAIEAYRLLYTMPYTEYKIVWIFDGIFEIRNESNIKCLRMWIKTFEKCVKIYRPENIFRKSNRCTVYCFYCANDVVVTQQML